MRLSTMMTQKRKNEPFEMIMTGEPLNSMMQFIRSCNPIDIDLNCRKNVHKQSKKFRDITS